MSITRTIILPAGGNRANIFTRLESPQNRRVFQMIGTTDDTVSLSEIFTQYEDELEKRREKEKDKERRKEAESRRKKFRLVK